MLRFLKIVIVIVIEKEPRISRMTTDEDESGKIS